MEIKVMSFLVEVSSVLCIRVKHLRICSMQYCNRHYSCGSQGCRSITSALSKDVSVFRRLRKVDYPKDLLHSRNQMKNMTQRIFESWPSNKGADPQNTHVWDWRSSLPEKSMMSELLRMVSRKGVFFYPKVASNSHNDSQWFSLNLLCVAVWANFNVS